MVRALCLYCKLARTSALLCSDVLVRSCCVLADTPLLCIAAAHFSWDYLQNLQANPTWNCTAAVSTLQYSNFVGGLTYSELSNQVRAVSDCPTVARLCPTVRWLN
jgi:hypothetical protein